MSKRFPLATASLFCLVTFLSSAHRLRAQSDGAAAANTAETEVFHNLRFRNLGPAVAGGRITSVVGVPGDPNLYYAGAGGGGVFKSVNGGTTWKAVFEHEATSSIGAIALAPSNPNLVWVGTGEANIRNDVIDGAGIYFSSDAGESWKCMGLKNAGQISRVIVDPHNSNVVFAGVLGHAWAPNPERGVFRTNDGGKTWKKVLFVDDTTGVADLTAQADNPQVLYAAMWHFRRHPWTLEDGGESSGIYRSTDGGETWKKLTEGLPAGPLGRIAVTSAPSNPSHLYALIAAKKGLLWQSLDMGDHWSEVTDNHALDVRPFYFSRMVVSPVDENKIYFLSFEMMESDDGGKTAHMADHGVHPDHHTLWIDPQNPSRMIQGNDGGVFLTMDAAKSWRFIDSLPVEQLYQVAADSKAPFNVCGGLQDNSAWCGPSTNLGRGGVTNADWFTVVGGDGEYSVPAPSDPNIIYSDAQNGTVERLDTRNHLARYERPYLPGVENMKPADLKYRFNWTSPIAVSEKDANEVYLGGNVVFKSTDGGESWSAISGDLTRNDKSKQPTAGSPVNHDISGAESYDTILALTLAHTDPKVIWVGTDDGCVQVTRDGGKNWKRVDASIEGAPQWARVYQIGVSPFDAGTAYVTYDAHEMDDRHAYAYKTSDYGTTWQRITTGLPDDVPVVVVRENPNVKGFLMAGTEAGLYYSADAGGHWRKFQAHFPTSPVWDLKFVKDKHDLVVATHGRGIFVFDDLKPLEQLNASIEAGSFHLFNAGAGTLFHRWESDEDNPVAYSTPNAPNGVAIDYLLKTKLEPSAAEKEAHQTPVKITISDAKGTVIATHHGPSDAGINRFIWNMRYQGAKLLESDVSTAPLRPGELEEARYFTSGPLVMPGSYEVAVTVNGETQKTKVTIHPDPNLKVEESGFRAQSEAALTMRNEATALNTMIERINSMTRQLDELKKGVALQQGGEKYASLLRQSEDLNSKLKAIKDSVYDPNIQHRVEEDDIHQLTALHANVGNLALQLSEAYNQPPNALVRARMSELRSEVEQRLSDFNELLKSDVAPFNKAAYGAGAPTVFSGEAVTIQAAPAIR